MPRAGCLVTGAHLILQNGVGDKLAGVVDAYGDKVLLSIAVLAVFAVVGTVASRLFDAAQHRRRHATFWGRHTFRLFLTITLIAVLVAVWAEDSGRMATLVGLISAGVAIALQRVITSIAGYFIILRGKLFVAGDRITIGGVRGDVVRLDFTQTTVMEMGQTEAESGDDPSLWIGGRQYTGRLVRITNDRIFDSPIYNFTREFPFFWEEIRVPLKYGSDHKRAESIVLEVVRRETADIVARAREPREHLLAHYALPGGTTLEPQSFLRLTDNWIELTVRFVVAVHGARLLKSTISRSVLERFESEGIGIASATFEIVGAPPLRVSADQRASGA